MGKIDWKNLREEAKKRETLSLKEEKWTNRIVKFIILGITIALLLTMGGFYWYYSQSLKPVNPDNSEKVEVTVPIGSSSSDIANLLKENNLIKNAEIFRFYMRSKNLSDLQAGTYEFSQTMDADQIIEQIKAGGKPIFVDVDKKITIIEGMQVKDIAKLVSENTSITEEEFLKTVNDETFIDSLITKFPSLMEGIKEYEGVRYILEGYLYPATYDYIAGMSANELITKMVETANLRFQEVREQVDVHWMTYHQILTLASIVEREGVTDDDRAMIAGVFFNRLEAGMPIQSDITVLYALDTHKEFVTIEDTQVDSPYNLYMYNGLTPGPINSPSMSAIQAVLNPTWNDYYYFVADLDTGDIYYSATIEEHDALVEEYVNKRQESIERAQSENENESESPETTTLSPENEETMPEVVDESSE